MPFSWEGYQVPTNQPTAFLERILHWNAAGPTDRDRIQNVRDHHDPLPQKYDESRVFLQKGADRRTGVPSEGHTC